MTVWRYHFREINHKCVTLEANTLEEAIEALLYAGFDSTVDDESGFFDNNLIEPDMEYPDNEEQWEQLPDKFSEAVQRCRECHSYRYCSEECGFTRRNPIDCSKFEPKEGKV